MLIAPATDHREERARFLRLAEAAGATLEHLLHPLRGPHGEALGTDVARLGAPPGEAHDVVVVTSGTHGVEGHTGSALQSLLLEAGELDALAPGVAVLLVHAANPYGMAWERRVDHDNVDINRNFVDFAAPLPENPGYEELAPLLNPTDDPEDPAWMAEVLAWGEQHGMPELFRALSGGQYRHPDGVQFGGQGPTWTRRSLEGVWRRHLAGAASVVHLDVHTGLGPCGALTIFQTADPDEPAAEAAAQWFPTVFRTDRVGDDEAVQSGVLGPGMDRALGEVPLVVPVVLEWGTHDEITVFSAMRADNWLHRRADPTSSDGERMRTRMREVFAMDDAGWRTTVADDGVAHVRAALDAAGTAT